MLGTLFGLSVQDTQQLCTDLGKAVEKGKIGDFVRCHLRTILQYYRDVHTQLVISFLTATILAVAGFIVLIITLIALMFNPTRELTVLGAIGGFLLEFIAGTVFWLYARTSKQFDVFHVCLERTCRYLLGYLIANEIQERKDDAFRDLVCIMANAPMIDIGQVQQGDDNSLRSLVDILRLQPDKKQSTPGSASKST